MELFSCASLVHSAQSSSLTNALQSAIILYISNHCGINHILDSKRSRRLATPTRIIVTNAILNYCATPDRLILFVRKTCPTVFVLVCVNSELIFQGYSPKLCSLHCPAEGRRRQFPPRRSSFAVTSVQTTTLTSKTAK